MARRRTLMHRLQDLVRLHRQKTGARETARLLGMGPNTERRYREALEQAGLWDAEVDALPTLEQLKAAVHNAYPPTQPKQQQSSLADYCSQVQEWVKKGLKPRAIYDRLRLQKPDFGGSLSAVKRLYHALRRAQGVQPQDVAIPVQTAPGEIAQVDLGYVGKLLDPVSMTLRKAWCFVMVLGYSRHRGVRIVFDQKMGTWLQLHVEAFAELGGVVATVVPDNLKAAVLRAAFTVDDRSELNRSYRELARHYGFKIDPTPAYDAPKKGKVEAGVKYVKGNFFVGRQQQDVERVRRELSQWVYQIAGTREHGTPHKQPLEPLEAIERAALLPLPTKPWEPMLWRSAKVHQDAHIALDKRLYWVPFQLIGQQVWVRATAHTVVLYADDERVATHDRRGSGYRSTQQGHLPAPRAPLRHRSRAYWEQRAEALGEPVGLYIRAVFDSDDVLLQLRTVQAIVTHLETFPLSRARAACQRAEHLGSYSYGAIKNILRAGLDLLPLPESAPTPASLPAPRFARSAAHFHKAAGGTA